MSAARYLVTGGRGFLGQYVVRALEAQGSQVTVLGRTVTNGERALCRDLAAGPLDLGEACFDAVFHVAGMAHRVPRTEAERQLFFRVNVDGTRNLLDALSRSSRLPEAVIFVSSVSVYGLEAGHLLDESTPRKAEDAYGASKRAAEDLLTEWSRRHGVPASIVRLPLVVGPGAPGNLGRMIRSLQRGRYLGIGAGLTRRSMVLASDVARFLPRISGHRGVYHLTDGHHPSFAELESALSDALQQRQPWRLPLSAARAGARVGDLLQHVTGVSIPLNSRTLMKMTSTLTFSDERAQEELGWRPSRVLDQISEVARN
jgi:nucleoside-diphosphate-sugar epimerase